jgi:predicted RNase H-like HicB family nuclease
LCALIPPVTEQATMANLQHTVKAVVRRGEQSGFVAECLEIAVVTQGSTLDETIDKLKEAVPLHLEGEDPSVFGLVNRPTIVVTLEVEPAYAQAS